MLETGILYEIKNYRYTVAGCREAEIEILVFSEKLFAWEALIVETKKTISDGKTYSTIEETLESCITEVDKIIIQIPRVKHSEETHKQIINNRVGGHPLFEWPTSHTTVRTVRYTAVPQFTH